MKVVEDKQRVLSYFKQRYGIPEEVFRDVEFLETRKAIWMVSQEMLSQENQSILSLKRINFAGIRLLRKTGRSFKPTTSGLQIIGSNATKNVVELQRDTLMQLLKTGHVKADLPEQRGFVILRYQGTVLGCGLIKDGILYSQFPRGRAEALAGSGLF